MEGPGISTWEDVGRASIRIDQGCSDDLHNEPLRAPDIHQDDASGTFPTGGDSKAKKAQKAEKTGKMSRSSPTVVCGRGEVMAWRDGR